MNMMQVGLIGFTLDIFKFFTATDYNFKNQFLITKKFLIIVSLGLKMCRTNE